jgi:hypothetical protein
MQASEMSGAVDSATTARGLMMMMVSSKTEGTVAGRFSFLTIYLSMLHFTPSVTTPSTASTRRQAVRLLVTQTRSFSVLCETPLPSRGIRGGWIKSF